MFNAIIDRATGLLGQAMGNVAGFPAAPAAQPPAASQRVDAHTQTKKTGGYGTSSAEQAIQAQLLAEATPVSASAPAGAPVWTTGTFTDGAQPAAPGTQQEAAAAAATPGSQPTPPFSSPMAGRSQPPQPPSRRGRARTQRPQQQLRKPAAALYQELSARWRAANPRTQSPSRPNPFSPEGVKKYGLASAIGLPTTTSGQSSAPAPTAPPSQSRGAFSRRVGRGRRPAPLADLSTAAQGQSSMPATTTATAATTMTRPLRPRNVFVRGGGVPGPAPPTSLPATAPGASVAAGTTGTNAGVGIQNPLPLPGGHHRQGLTRAELGIPEGAQPRLREEIKSWIQEFFDTRRQQETAATAGGSTGRAPGTPGSRPARLTTPQRPARTAAPTRRNPPVIPGDRPTRQGGVRPMPPPPAATSASSAFPTPVIPTPAQTAALTIGRQAAANPQVAPRTAPAVSAFPTPVIATPPPAQTSVPVAASPAAGRPATGNTRQPEVQAPWRGPIAGTPLFAPRITPATSATPARVPPAPAPPPVTGRSATGSIGQPGRGAISGNPLFTPRTTRAPIASRAPVARTVPPNPPPPAGRRVTVDNRRQPGTQTPQRGPTPGNPLITPRTSALSSRTPAPRVATPAPAPAPPAPAAGGRPLMADTSRPGPLRAPGPRRPPPPETLSRPTRAGGAQQGASASTTAQATTAAPGRRSLRLFWPSQQPRTAPVSTPAATPSRGGAQQLGSQQGRSSSSQARGQPGQQRGWRSRDDLFEPAALDKAGIVAPDSSDRPPAPLPTAPSGIDYGTRGDGQSPGSILRKRLADMAQTAGGSDPKRVRWA